MKFITLEWKEGQVSVAIGIYTGQREEESWHGISIRRKGEGEREIDANNEERKKERPNERSQKQGWGGGWVVGGRERHLEARRAEAAAGWAETVQGSRWQAVWADCPAELAEG